MEVPNYRLQPSKYGKYGNVLISEFMVQSLLPKHKLQARPHQPETYSPILRICHLLML